MKAEEFSCVSNQFTASFVSWKMVSYEKKGGGKKKKKEGRSANGAKTGTGSGEVSTALACLAAVVGRMFHSEGLGWLL